MKPVSFYEIQDRKADIEKLTRTLRESEQQLQSTEMEMNKVTQQLK